MGNSITMKYKLLHSMTILYCTQDAIVIRLAIPNPDPVHKHGMRPGGDIVPRPVASYGQVEQDVEGGIKGG